jgi:hypothetical protein
VPIPKLAFNSDAVTYVAAILLNLLNQ